MNRRELFAILPGKIGERSRLELQSRRSFHLMTVQAYKELADADVNNSEYSTDVSDKARRLCSQKALLTRITLDTHLMRLADKGIFPNSRFFNIGGLTAESSESIRWFRTEFQIAENQAATLDGRFSEIISYENTATKIEYKIVLVSNGNLNVDVALPPRRKKRIQSGEEYDGAFIEIAGGGKVIRPIQDTTINSVLDHMDYLMMLPISHRATLDRRVPIKL